MRPSTVQKLREDTLRQAVISLYMSVRKATSLYRLPKSTIHAAFYARIKAKCSHHHRRALSDSEETAIGNTLLKFADKGAPLTRHHVEEVVASMVSRMTLSRRITLPFKDGKPGPRFFRNFMARRCDVLQFNKPLRQEHQRFQVVNAEALCEHFCTLAKLVKEHNLDDTRIWNLDECGVTPGRDANDRTQHRRVTRRKNGQDERTMAIRYDKRVTFMPVISAAGESEPCLFVFKGSSFSYRKVLVDSVENIDSIANHLPLQSVVTMREEGGGVDRDKFLEWSYLFVSYVKSYTYGGKVLLIYDGYRSHMSLSVLQLFANNGIIIYALPAHIPGKTQPLDVVIFSSYKRKLNNLMCNTVDSTQNGCDVYGLCDLMKAAYESTFTVTLIKSAFRRAGIWPVDSSKLMSVPRPVEESLSRIITVREMEEMVVARRARMASEIFGENVTVEEKGFVNTLKGAVLTSSAAIKLIEERAKLQRQVKIQQELSKRMKEVRAAAREEREREAASIRRVALDKRRAFMAGMSYENYKSQLRSLQERRAYARLRASKKRLSGLYH